MAPEQTKEKDKKKLKINKNSPLTLWRMVHAFLFSPLLVTGFSFNLGVFLLILGIASLIIFLYIAIRVYIKDK